MSTLNLRRFSKPDTLRRIDPEHLINFLKPHEDYFSERGLKLNSVDLNYSILSEVLLTPDAGTPDELSEALYYINEMSTPEAFDHILAAIEDKEISITGNPAPADLAIQVWLQDKSIIKRLHAEQVLSNPRSFEYFIASCVPEAAFEKPPNDTIKILEGDLDTHFAKKKRGRTSKVSVYIKDDFVCFLVRHGDPFKREGVIKKGKTESIFYQPEKCDVIVYNAFSGEIRMNANSKWEKELYRKMFGRHFFGSDDFFSVKAKFSLEPIRQFGEVSLLCDDIDGLDWVKLKEVQFSWEGTYKEVEVKKSLDIFASMRHRSWKFPEGGDLTRASFLIKFSNAKRARTVVVSNWNTAQFKRDDDAETLEEWMSKRGFIVTDEEESVEQPLAVAVSR